MPHTLPPFPEDPSNDPSARKAASALYSLSLGLILLFLAATIRHADDIARLVMLALGVVGVVHGMSRAQAATVHNRIDRLSQGIKTNYAAVASVKADVNAVETRVEGIEEDLTNMENQLGLMHRDELPAEEAEEGGPRTLSGPHDPPPA